MAYDRDKIFKDAKLLIEDNKLFFIEDIISLLPIAKATFYDFFKVDSNELNELKELLDKNRVELKISMRSKWYKSDSPALQMGLMKIIANEEELRKLSMNHNTPFKEANEEDVNRFIIVPGVVSIDEWEKMGVDNMKRIRDEQERISNDN